MSSLVDAARIAELVQSLPGYGSAERLSTGHPVYEHMGATLADAGLQAGVRYETVVAPRVRRVLANWPAARTTSQFVAVADRLGMCDLLAWRHPGKPQRVRDMAGLLLRDEVQTESELSSWLSDPLNRQSLLTLHGVGPKTVDYLRKLAGQPALAVDRHLRRFALEAGVRLHGYGEAASILGLAAGMLGIDCGALDSIVWRCMSGQGRPHVHPMAPHTGDRVRAEVAPPVAKRRAIMGVAGKPAATPASCVFQPVTVLAATTPDDAPRDGMEVVDPPPP
jgi:hypothetical protein